MHGDVVIVYNMVEKDSNRQKVEMVDGVVESAGLRNLPTT